ncbi:hypothetical protein Afe04nite_47740 [Asanoa ferruginea]|nr:hypothetical protein Afe04nite_47740 [Asanoa ferruginea]
MPGADGAHRFLLDSVAITSSGLARLARAGGRIAVGAARAASRLCGKRPHRCRPSTDAGLVEQAAGDLVVVLG